MLVRNFASMLIQVGSARFTKTTLNAFGTSMLPQGACLQESNADKDCGLCEH